MLKLREPSILGRRFILCPIGLATRVGQQLTCQLGLVARLSVPVAKVHVGVVSPPLDPQPGAASTRQNAAPPSG